MRRILCINPMKRDTRELQHLHTYILFSCLYHRVADYTTSFDIENTYMSLTDEIENLIYAISDVPLDGIFSTHDYPGQIVSSILAYEAGLPGPEPHTILPLQDKYYTRQLEHNVVPEATPRFETISHHKPYIEHVSFPCIVKPIKGAGSLGTMYVRNQAELEMLSDVPDLYLQPLHELLMAYSDYDISENSLLVEEYAPGEQVTVDGFVNDGNITIIGIVDCHVDPYTLQFDRFIYPSRLPHAVQKRMHGIVTTLVQATGLNNTFFDVELRYDAQNDRITIIEMNTRMSSQFADMYEKVDGFHPYQTAIDIACGDEPHISYRNGQYKQAQGFCIHTDADYFVQEVPTPDEKTALLKEIPDMRIEIEVEPGTRMSECDHAVFIYGYTMLNIGGNSDAELEEKYTTARNRLRFRFLT